MIIMMWRRDKDDPPSPVRVAAVESCEPEFQCSYFGAVLFRDLPRPLLGFADNFCLVCQKQMVEHRCRAGESCMQED